MPFSDDHNSYAAHPHTNGFHANGVNGNAHHANGVNGEPTHDHGVNGSRSNGVKANGHSPQTTGIEPIAICGMAVRLPGGLQTPQQLWDFLASKGDARGKVPASRYNVDAFYSTTGKPGTTKTQYGYFLDPTVDLAAMDTSFFASRGVDRIDPHQRQMLEVVRECFEDAGETNWRGRNIGCYMGTFGEDWVEMYAKETQQYGIYRATGHGDFMLPNRVSGEMDLRGPSLIVRTACSSALVGLHEACLAIGRGDCESAVIGGANLILAPYMTTTMSEQLVLAPDGSCKTFSADADGYARGEAINAVFIKPLQAALRDGNPIRAVIRATASNCDGASPGGVSAPNAEAQEAMIRRAYEVAGIEDFAKTAFVECHGTGTPVGDPLETDAVAGVFGPTGGVYIGSVKPNLGHSEGASGLTSLIKSILALENKTLLPNIKFSQPNPNIKFDVGLKVPTELMPWPEGRHERISVNSFGIGGSNAHVILDSAASYGIEKSSTERTTPQLLLFSGTSPESVKTLATSYNDYLDRNPGHLRDVAFTLARRREHLPQRSYAIGKQHMPLSPSAVTKVPSQAPRLVMVFTGQGAQWPMMGQELLQDPDFPLFRKTISLLDGYLQSAKSCRPNWTIEDELLQPAQSSRLSQAEMSQPLCTAVQIALVDLLASIGVVPSAVVGHSSGELAAAYAAGALTAQEAIVAAFHRGTVSKLQKKAGAMAAVGMGRDQVERFLVPGVVIACENSPHSVTLSGDKEQVHQVISQIKQDDEDVLARALKVDKAYHSHHMVEIGGSYHQLIVNEIVPKAPGKLFFSSVTGQEWDADSVLGAEYWQRNLESPVLFSKALTALLQHEDLSKGALLLEVGPHAALAGPIRQIQAQLSKNAPYLSVLARNEDCVETFLHAVGKLHCANVPVDLAVLIPEGATLGDLPRYPWNHSESYWYESRLSKEWRQRRFAHHDLLGIRLPESTDLNPVWRNLFHLQNAEWMRDHQIVEDIVFPFAGYVGLVGEAIRQIDEEAYDSFELRHVVVSSALVLVDGTPVEMMTSFRKQRLTDMLDGAWWEFSIVSYQNQSWVKHCTGEVRAGRASPAPCDPFAVLPRKITAQRCYDTIRRAGLAFGPAFRSMTNIRSDTMSELATASASSTATDRDAYHLHPVLIDAGLQLSIVAATRGFNVQGSAQMLVPVLIEELTVNRTAQNIDLMTKAEFNRMGEVRGETVASADGHVAMTIKGLRLRSIDDGDGAQALALTSRVEWGPHADFVDLASLFLPGPEARTLCPLLDHLSRAAMASSLRQIAGRTTELPLMQRYVDWMKGQLAACNDVTRSIWYPEEDLSARPTFDQLSDEELQTRIDTLVEELRSTTAVAGADGIQRVCSNFPAIYTGETQALELLLADDLLTRLYQSVEQSDRSAFFKRLAFTKPNLRILEIGAGTGATTAALLEAVATPGGQHLFSEYVYTDISAAMFIGPKERFQHVRNMEYTVLDITKDPGEQGFANRKFDLIIASNVLHATPSLQQCLLNVHKLLAPEGYFFLTELNPVSKWPNYIWGTLPGWWAGDADGRKDEPYVSPERWEAEFTAAGFAGLTALALDADAAPYQGNAMMVTRLPPQKSDSKKVTLLCHDVSETGVVGEELVKRGYTVTARTLADLPFPENQDIISILDLAYPFFADITEEHLQAFQKFVASLKCAGILWVTNPCHIDCTDPRYAQSLGTARTIGREGSFDFGFCEVDDVASSADLVVDVFARFQIRVEDDTLKPDLEYAISRRTVNVSRIFPFSLDDTSRAEGREDMTVWGTPKPGRLSDLQWFKQTSPALDADEVEIEPHASGLNFKDILVAMGIVDASRPGFGLEAAGIVSRVGPTTSNLKVGDRVIFMGYATFASHIVISERLCAKMPDDLSFEDGATMPCVYSTSIYSLFTIGGLQKGQSVLIHSATGGVGIASIQLANKVGAEVFVTVGNEEKVQYLMSTFGLPRNRIFHSRDSSFVQDVMRETNGEGVDLALNSLSGELLHATWKCIAKFGKLVEIGKRDLLGAAKLDMTPFLDNRSYCCVDLDQLCFARPLMVKQLLETTMDYYRGGFIKPIRPIKVMPAARLLDAFRYMQQGQHMGKIVIRLRDESSGSFDVDTADARSRDRGIELDGSGAYLLVGGLGGLGRGVATWMVERGARHLIFLSRSAGDRQQHQDFIREIESMGCAITMVPGDVAVAEDVQRAVQQAQGQLRGVLQLSMVLRDQPFEKMSLEEWNTTSHPKVRGSWNLHHATAGEQLDFFLLFSSLSGVIGWPGQANYAGANTFLDAFAQYRASLGLPASVIDIGAVMDIGYVAQNQKLLQKLEASNALGNVTRSSLLRCIAAAMTRFSRASNKSTMPGATFAVHRGVMLGIETNIPIASPQNRAPWKKDLRFAIYHNDESDSAGGGSASSDALKAFLARARHDAEILKAPDTATFLATEIGKKIYALLLRSDEDLDTTTSLANLGMDSLVAIEMRSWWKQVFGFDVTVIQLLNMGSLDALGKHVADTLLTQLMGEESQDQPSTST